MTAMTATSASRVAPAPIVLHGPSLAASAGELVDRLTPARPAPPRPRPPGPVRRSMIRKPHIPAGRHEVDPRAVVDAVLTIRKELRMVLTARETECCERCGCLCFAWEPCPGCRAGYGA